MSATEMPTCPSRATLDMRRLWHTRADALADVLPVVVRAGALARRQLVERPQQVLVAGLQVDGLAERLRVVDARGPVDLRDVALRVTKVRAEGDAMAHHPLELAAVVLHPPVQRLQVRQRIHRERDLPR